MIIDFNFYVMHDLFFKNFNNKVPVGRQELNVISQHLTIRVLLKNQYLLQAGDTCKFIAFVQKGALRQYTTDSAGSKHIFQFAIESWTISDMESFLTGNPSIYHIDALEDSELVLIDKSAHEKLLKEEPKYEEYMRLQLTGAYLAMQRRINSSISLSPEERYNEFVLKNPDIVQRVPQHMIASYLGLQPETLSRIRKKMANKI
jgi:CRP-like cAMP-binding protein